MAASKLGAKMILLNTGFGAPQLSEVISREGVAVLIYDEEFENVVSEVPDVRRFIAQRGATASPAAALDDLMLEGAGITPPPPKAAGTIVLLTAGTTGLPKGAPRQVKSTSGIIQLLDRVPLRVNEATYVAVPLFHAVGLLHVMVAFSFGSTVVLSNRFDAKRSLSLLEQYHCTAIVAVPTMLRRVLDLGADEIAQRDLSTLRIFFCGGSILSRSMVEEAQEQLGDVLYNMYASTEVGLASVGTPADLRVSPGSAGKPPIGCAIRLLDENDVVIAEHGTKGRIFVASNLKFGGYTDGSSKKLIHGMMASGDVGHFDAYGNLYVDGRDDDMIVSGGENVYPGEVEELLTSHHSIAEVYVNGVADDDFGRRLAAHVVLLPGATLTAEEIKIFVKSNLARHKVPRDVYFLDELPRNAMGKVARLEFDPKSGL